MPAASARLYILAKGRFGPRGPDEKLLSTIDMLQDQDQTGANIDPTSCFTGRVRIQKRTGALADETCMNPACCFTSCLFGSWLFIAMNRNSAVSREDVHASSLLFDRSANAMSRRRPDVADCLRCIRNGGPVANVTLSWQPVTFL